MDNREWQTFVTVVDEGNITRAAEKLFLSQPALSYRLRHCLLYTSPRPRD